MKYDYYYNDVPGQGLQRNNLLYTSLISDDKRVFVQWYHNDTEYHKGQNQVIDSELMEEKWQRELKYLKIMNGAYNHLVPNILDIDEQQRKIYLEIDGIDFWNCAGCSVENYSKVIPNWQEQILEILRAHRRLGLYKYSLHPSSYWPVDGKLKSINYFFTYHESEGPISIADHASHIYSTRQDIIREKIKAMDISWEGKEPLNILQHLCFESFRTNYTNDFIDKCKEVYID